MIPSASVPAMSSGATAPIIIPGRLMSVDVLRGFDMFWIIGGDILVQAIHTLFGDPFTGVLARQFDHSSWAGFHVEDLIFPLFLFIAGISLVFSLSKTIERDGRGMAITRVLRRGLLLMALGIIYYGGLGQGFAETRVMGVLQRIGVAYLFTGLLFCFLKPRGLIIACCALPVGYWALMANVPIRDIHLDQGRFEQLASQTGIHDAHALFDRTTATVHGHFDPGYNLSDHIDFQFLPGRLCDRYYDPEGLLSTLPAIATCLLGVFAGFLLSNRSISDRRRLVVMISAGLGMLLVGELWGLEFPVIKKIWTSSFVLVAGGWSMLLLALFHWLIDQRGWMAWTPPFVWVGMNAIVIYMVGSLCDVRAIANRVIGGPVTHLLDSHIAMGLGEVVGIASALGLMLLLAWFLYRRQVFVRL